MRSLFQLAIAVPSENAIALLYYFSIGLWLSYWLNLTCGATYLLSTAVQPLVRRVRPNQILNGGAFHLINLSAVQ